MWIAWKCKDENVVFAIIYCFSTKKKKKKIIDDTNIAFCTKNYDIIFQNTSSLTTFYIQVIQIIYANYRLLIKHRFVKRYNILVYVYI